MSSVSFDNLPRAHELRLAQRHVRGVVCVCVCGPCSARIDNATPRSLGSRKRRDSENNNVVEHEIYWPAGRLAGIKTDQTILRSC